MGSISEKVKKVHFSPVNEYFVENIGFKQILAIDMFSLHPWSETSPF
jgi:hypothetical protein